MLKINSYFAALSILSSTLLLNQSFAHSCHGHFVNNSNESWVISFDNSSHDGGEGNVYFRLESGQYCDESHIKNGPCTIYPGEELNVDYTKTNGQINGTIYLTDHNNNSKSWPYGTGTKGFTDCMWINTNPQYEDTQDSNAHDSDDQGAVTLNNPSDGGALFKGDAWN